MLTALVLQSPELDAAGQMALDEALLSSHVNGAVTLRFYRWRNGSGLPVDPGPAVMPFAATFGLLQPYAEAERALRRLGRGCDFPLVRRPTGGGLVLHDGDLTFSLVFPWAKLCAASWIYKELHRAVHLGLKGRGLESRLWSLPREEALPAAARRRAACFPEPEPIDLVDGFGRKVLGGALRRRRSAGLYQGSLRPEGFGCAREGLMEAVTEGMSLRWRAPFARAETPAEVLTQAGRLREERFATEAWNQRR